MCSNCMATASYSEDLGGEPEKYYLSRGISVPEVTVVP
jgi:hypothetical protein